MTESTLIYPWNECIETLGLSVSLGVVQLQKLY